MLVVKPIRDTKATSRVLVIHPTTESFQQQYLHRPVTEDQAVDSIPLDSVFYDIMSYPLFPIGGSADLGWGIDDFCSVSPAFFPAGVARREETTKT